MDKESIYELQKIDCNCNDCGYMIRNMDLYNKSLKDHEKWQLDYFNGVNDRMIETAKWWRDNKGDHNKYNSILAEVKKRKFQFDKSTNTISFGMCEKFFKSISFIPNTLQLETQTCFVHRKDLVK